MFYLHFTIVALGTVAQLVPADANVVCQSTYNLPLLSTITKVSNHSNGRYAHLPPPPSAPGPLKYRGHKVYQCNVSVLSRRRVVDE